MRMIVDAPPRAPARSSWTLLSNHGHVLICLADDPDVRLRDVARRVGLTERSAFALVSDLISGGFVSRTRIGRRNRYTVNPHAALAERLETSATVRDIVAAIGTGAFMASEGSDAPR